METDRREIIQSIGVSTHEAVLNTSEMTLFEGCKLPFLID